MAPTPSLAVLSLCAGALLAGCTPTETAPTAPPTAPRFNFVNGPAELPNVIRFSTDDAGFFVPDPASGLVAVEGLPADPSTFFGCENGQNPASTLTWQQVGWLRELIHAHVVGRNVNIHVFQLSELDTSQQDPFLHLWCTGTPIAAGTGDATLVDNDFFGTGGKNNAVTFGMRGTLTDLRTGQSLRLTARFHVVQNVAGYPAVEPTLKVENIYVRLNPVGGK
jgi:hypothetical protein